MLLRTRVCRHRVEILLAVFGACARRCNGSRGTLCVTFWERIPCPTATATPHSRLPCPRIPVSSHLHQHALFYFIFFVFFLIPALTCVKRQNFYSKAKKTAGQSERACADQQPDHRQVAKCPPPRPGLRAAVPTGTVPEDTALQNRLGRSQNIHMK